MRRRIPRLIRIVAFIGVPGATIAVTGGPETISFWFQAVTSGLVAYMGGVMLSIPLFVVIIPIYWLLEHLTSLTLKQLNERFNPVVWILVSIFVYISGVDLEDATGVWLPTPWTNVGALLVMGVAGAAMYGLVVLADDLEIPVTRTGPYVSQRYEVEEPQEEFWTAEMVSGWRAWNWMGGALHGVFDVWPSIEYTAACDRCPRVPGWSHTCGVYATKSRAGVQTYRSEPVVVGKVDMWGDIVEHERGYRTSHARIVELWVSSADLAEKVGRKYPVEVHVMTNEGG